MKITKRYISNLLFCELKLFSFGKSFYVSSKWSLSVSAQDVLDVESRRLKTWVSWTLR